MSELQKGARVLLFLVAGALTFASVVVATAAPATPHVHRDWQAVAVLLWIAVGLLVVNLGLGEITVKRGRT